MFALSAVSSETIAPDDEANFTLIFSPTGVGNKSVIVYMPSNDPDESFFTFTVTATSEAEPEPQIAISENSVIVPTGGEYRRLERAGFFYRYYIGNIANRTRISHDFCHLLYTY
jgi:hypothetical protein